MQTIRPATSTTIVDVETACRHLRAARACLAQAGAPRALEKLQHALKSSEGALRHAHHRHTRAQRSEVTIQARAK